MNGFRPAIAPPYNFMAKTFRTLWHQTLDTLLRYPDLPRTYTNHDADALTKPLIFNKRTLSSAATTIHQDIFDDTIVTEIWDKPGTLSTYSGFFYEMIHFFRHAQATNKFLIWYPKDKNEKAYTIQPLDIIVGESENMAVRPIDGRNILNDQWITAPMRFKFRILKPFIEPEAAVFLAGS